VIVLGGEPQSRMDRVCQSALYGAAGDLQVLAFEVGTAATYEPDMRSALRRALQVSLGLHPVDGAAGARVKPEMKAELDDFPSVGAFDLAIESQGGGGPYLAVFELKWCRGPNDVWMCLWDVAKTGLAAATGRANAGYVIAGAPVEEWERRPLVAPLFDGVEFRPARVNEEYEKPWAFLLTGAKKARPRRLPSKITTQPLGAVRVQAQESYWELRAVRVYPDTTGWVEFDGTGWPKSSESQHQLEAIRGQRWRVVAGVPQTTVWLIQSEGDADCVRALDGRMRRLWPELSFATLKKSHWWQLFSEDLSGAPLVADLLAEIEEIVEGGAEVLGDPDYNLPSLEGRDFDGGDATFHADVEA
jgi:hypothetical protein